MKGSHEKGVDTVPSPQPLPDASPNASIGAVPLLCDPTLQAGLAQLLVSRPKVAHTLTHNGARLTVSPETPYVVCSFANARSLEDAARYGTQLIDEGLDILSMKGAANLVTRDTRDEYFAWWLDDGRRVVAAVATSDFALNATMRIESAGAKAAASAPAVDSPYNPSFHYFRLAQISDSSFEAYRNLYLAFELLLSTRYPKTVGREIEWLRNSLSLASAEVQLSDLAPEGHAAPVEFVLTTVYTNARLPLFHAKNGRTYFANSMREDARAAVADALFMLTIIVLRMVEAWHDTRRPRLSLSTGLIDAMGRACLGHSAFVASSDARFAPDDGLQSPSIASGVRFDAAVNDEFCGMRRLNVHGAVEAEALQGLPPLRVVHLVNDTIALWAQTFEAPVCVGGFHSFEVVHFVRVRSETEPRTIYPR